MTLAELSAYKDGITDALLEGYRCDWHDNLYYYKRGYEFGIHLYNQIKEEKNVLTDKEIHLLQKLANKK